MSSSPIVNRIRVIPRETDFLENNVGSRGEIYFDNDNDTLRLYNKETKGGFLLVNEKKLADALDGLSTGSSISTVFDLTDVNSNSETLDADNGQGKILSWDQTVNAFVPTDLSEIQEPITDIFALTNVSNNSVTLDADNGQGKILSWDQTVNAFVPIDLPTSSAGASVTIADNVPTESTAGDLWWNSNEGVLKIYYDDGTSQQWIDATPTAGGFSGSYNDLIDIPLSNSFSGSWNDLSDKPVLFSGSWNDLSDKPNFAAVATSGSYTDLSNTPNVTGKAIAMSIVFG